MVSIPFENFLAEVHPAYREFVAKTHAFLLEAGCKLKIERAKSGYVVSYYFLSGKSQRAVLNYVFRKKGMLMRIYAEHVAEYPELLEGLPEDVAQGVEKAPICKRLHDPAACSSRCPMGYRFTLHGEFHQKCRYNAFMILVNEQNIPHIRAMLEREMALRGA